MNMQMPSRFEKQLEGLYTNILNLTSVIEQVIATSIKAFMNQDATLAKGVTENKKEITNLVNLVEGDAMRILLLQSPVASDLRYLTTVLKVVTELERIGAQARDICSIVIDLSKQKFHKQQITIPLMAETTTKMVKSGIECFINKDVKLAKIVIDMDDEIDAMFAKAKGNMIEKIREHPEYTDQAIFLLMVAKYFEKIGDHAVNIAEWAIFCKTGEKKNVRLI